MSRIFDQKNVWGSQGGLNAQRADLWKIDFSQVVTGLNDQIRPSLTVGTQIETDLEPIQSTVEPYFISSVTMPTLKIKADEFRRDSRPYMMPGFDEPMSEIKVVFMVETPANGTTTKIYQFLEAWRAFVRAGRGGMSNERKVTLGTDYKVKFRFPVTIILFRGNANPKIHQVSESLGSLNSEYYGSVDQLNEDLAGLSDEEKSARLKSILASGGVFGDVTFQSVENDLENCAVFQVHNMWLSSMKMTDLDYSKGNELVRMEAVFYADNIVDLNNKA